MALDLLKQAARKRAVDQVSAHLPGPGIGLRGDSSAVDEDRSSRSEGDEGRSGESEGDDDEVIYLSDDLVPRTAVYLISCSFVPGSIVTSLAPLASRSLPFFGHHPPPFSDFDL